MFTKRKRIWLICTVAVLATCALVVAFVTQIRSSIEGERSLQAAITASEAVEKYLQQNKFSKWPESWEDLSSVHVSSPIMAWPRDRVEIEKRVSINFNASLAAVSNQTIDTFDGFHVTRGRTPLVDAYAIAPLIELVREQLHGRDADATGHPPEVK